MNLTEKFYRRLFVIYALLVLLLSVLPLNSKTNHTLVDVTVIHIRLDYLLHSLVFLPFVALYIVAFEAKGATNIFILLVTGLFYALFAEGVQYMLPYRSYNINDMIANLLGLSIGAVALLFKNNLLRLKTILA